MSWHLGRMTGFDLETTGPDPLTARIVTACIVQCGGGSPVDSATWLSDVDGEEIPDEAAAIHGVTTVRARAEGAPLAQVVAELLAGLGQAIVAGLPIVAMNARYDLTLLDREAERYGLDPLPIGPVIDPYVIDKAVDKCRRGSRKLTALCDHYKVPIGDAHQADADAIAACRVAWRQATRYEQVARMTLPELHHAQVGWAAEQAASLQEYFRRKDPTAVVEGAWPLIPRQQGGDA
ncbi:3'-5' exonuclease [Streptomyces scopuliridis]|uniref:DNA polymerase III subunit epsilon n=1 Tax=Streptomyces scopuliridis RB72 TaxID=1440053 RepID=A0A2T7SP19_9ACTN|nr:3'-5' exonuclease [Streptomyces scopuliridis]PVE04631.1 DNA polymerase III subunit epsilon [Streptomyces scopuliridis RB72]